MALQGGFASEKNVAIAPQYQVILGKYNDFDNRFGVPEKDARAIAHREITPNQAKNFLTGKGHSEKNLILLKTFQKYGIACEDDNVADAINCNMIGRAALGLAAPANEAERAVVAELNRAPEVKVKKPRKPKAA